MTIAINIDGTAIELKEGCSILEAARENGVEIPTLCEHASLSPTGSCRMCLVELDGMADPVTACTHQVSDGLSIQTDSANLRQQRKLMLELMLSEFHSDSSDPNAAAPSEFSRLVEEYGAHVPQHRIREPRFEFDSDPSPFIRVNLNECILCTRCIRACEETQGRFVWGLDARGADTALIAGAGTDMISAGCESCGACANVCPTHALTDRFNTSPDQADCATRTTCGYCGVGCQFDLLTTEDRIVGVASTPEAPVNGDSLCVKGRYGWDFVHHEDRLTRPRVRASLLKPADGLPGHVGSTEEIDPWIEVDWSTALDIVARKFAEIRKDSGPDALGFLSSAKCSNEENYLVQKLARQVIGTNNVDHCARLCHSSTVAGLGMAFGSGAMSNSMDDIVESAEAIFIIGSNTTEQHPVFGTRIRQAVMRRGIPLVVADPRRIDICDFATLHVRQRPGTDVALINGLMHLIIENGWHDEAFIRERCEGFEELAAAVDSYTPDRVAEITGIPADQLQTAARILGTSDPAAVIWSMGITQHTTGVLNVLSLANLQMLLGNMGRPGGGVNPLRGQNNVQGACDMGTLPNVFPGYRPVSDEGHRESMQQSWKLNSLEPWELPSSPGLTVTEMVDRVGDQTLRGLYILGENPALTDPDGSHVRECLSSCEFLVLQEIFPSATSEFADVLLPGVTFAERTGTFTNTERRVQLFHEAIPAIGSARPDWHILSDLGQRCLETCELTPSGNWAGWQYQSSSEIMDEIAATTPSYAGINHGRLEAGERLQWPVTGTDHAGTPILHVGRFTRGPGKFHACEHIEPRESTSREFPLLLTTGRVLYHWHAGEMTRRSHGLNQACPDARVEINPADARRAGIDTDDAIELSSLRGQMTAFAQVTDRVPEGVVFANFHFTAEHNANNLTIAALDPVAKIPEYKVCAVSVKALRPQSSAVN